MNKMLLMLLVVGILVCGMYFVTEEMCQNIFSENIDITEKNHEDSRVNVIPCGGGNGGGDVPG
jgi:hypothetical protein